MYVSAMSIADFEQLLTLMPMPKEERSVLREGYLKLLALGWPTHYINLRMCERAHEGLVRPYEGYFSWIAYRGEWAWNDTKVDPSKYGFPLV